MDEKPASFTRSMAVNSPEQTNGPKPNVLSAGEHEIHRKTTSSSEAGIKKKSCFQITKVITNSDGDLDDDLDDTTADDPSLASFDISKNEHDDTMDSNFSPQGISNSPDAIARLKSSTPDGLSSSGDANLLLPTNIFENGAANKGTQPLKNISIEQIISPELAQVQQVVNKESRFKVVKIESKEPFKRGRWSCHDYLDPPTVEKSDNKPTDLHEAIGSGNSSNASSVHFAPGSEDPMCDSANSDQAAALFASQGSSMAKNSTSQTAPVQSSHANAQPPAQQHKHVNGGVPPAHILPQQPQAPLTNSNASNNPTSFASSALAAPTSASHAADVTTDMSAMLGQGALQRTESSAPASSSVASVQPHQQVEYTTPAPSIGHAHAQTYMKANDASRAAGTAGGDGVVTSSMAEFSGDHVSTSQPVTSGAQSAFLHQSTTGDDVMTSHDVTTLHMLSASGGTASSSSLTPPLLEMVTQRMGEKDDDSTNRCVQQFFFCYHFPFPS